MVLGVLPESWLTAEDMPRHAWTAYLPAIIGGALVLFVFAYLIHGVVRRQWFRKTYAAYYGSLARTLLPATAMVVIVLNVVAQPYLFHTERHLIAADTIMDIDPGGGFTAIETRLVHRLQTEMKETAARFPELQSQSEK